MSVAELHARRWLVLALLLAAPLVRAASPPALAPAPAPAASAATAADAVWPAGLEATLQRLAGSAALRGTLTVAKTSVSGSGAKAKRSAARISLEVSAAHGLSLRVPAAVLAEAAQQLAAHQRDPELPTPTADLLGSVGIVQVQRMLDPASELRLVLIGAKLLQQSATTLDGVPATLLRFELPLRATHSERAMVKSYHDELSLWLDASGVPLGYTQNTRTDIGWFLLNADTQRSERGRFQVVDGHLVTTQLDVQQSGSALGHHGDSTTQYSLQPSAPASAAQVGAAAPAHPALRSPG